MTDASAAPPTTFVLFGATGDLARRMVLPAFFTLARNGLLPERWAYVGNGRGNVSHLDFRAYVHDVVRDEIDASRPPWLDFERRGVLRQQRGRRRPAPVSLLDVIEEIRGSTSAPYSQLVHYLAVPPTAFAPLTEGLGQHGLRGGARVVFEKPFGTSPRGLRRAGRPRAQRAGRAAGVSGSTTSSGKKATQDLHVLRFANGLFDRDVEQRARARRPDRRAGGGSASPTAPGSTTRWSPCSTCSSPTCSRSSRRSRWREPASLEDAAHLQAAREEVIGCFRPLDSGRGRPGAVRGLSGRAEGIRRALESTDTYVAARLWIDNDRWRGVPFLLRTGKRLARSHQRVSLILREPRGTLDGRAEGGQCALLRAGRDR